MKAPRYEESQAPVYRAELIYSSDLDSVLSLLKK
jgi:hypothetical protein